MLITILIVSLIFLAALAGRLGGAYRAALVRRWPTLLFAGAAMFAATRGALWSAAALGAAAALAWWLYPRLASGPTHANDPGDSAADAEARALLGVGGGASAAEIRRAYRTKMARAHPDRGGSHAAAARLTAARDRLLRGRPR